MQVEGQHGGSLLLRVATGARVSNAYPTFPLPGNSPAKAGLMPDVVVVPHGVSTKGFRYGMGMRLISLLAG